MVYSVLSCLQIYVAESSEFKNVKGYCTMHKSQAGFNPPITRLQYNTERDIDSLTIQATTAES